MIRSDEFGLNNAHQPLDRHFFPKKSHVTKYMNSIWRDKRSPFDTDFWDEDAPLRDKPLLTENQVKVVWQQEISKARIAKGKVTEDDMLQSAEQIERLAGLVQERYAVSQAEAEKQIAAFLRRRHS